MRYKLCLGSVLLVAAAVWAQQDPNQDPNQAPAQDPPSRVARLNLIQGQVSFQPATVSDWTAATLNYPVTIGDHLYADDDSRAELHVGATAVRVGPRSAMSFLNLDDRLVQVRLDQGALIVRVKSLEPDEAYEIDTAQGAISLLSPGEYRIDTDPDRNATMVTVRSGDAEVNFNGGAFPVHIRETAYFPGDGQPQVQTENPLDAFDQFSTNNDRSEDAVPEPRYVSQDMPGWQDLERNGSWTEEPEYGAVWRPRTVQADWAPYRDGHWAWIEPWGWTWIDDAPWGFAPFHYGRWAMVRGGWGWIPGPFERRPVYAPALVAFVGGNNFSLAVGVGGGMGAVAWFPLGPRERYIPGYHASQVYVNRINVTRVTVVNQVYVNRSFGFTAVDHRVFAGAQPVRRAILRVPNEAVRRGDVVYAAPVAPQRMSVMGRSGAPSNVPHPVTRVMERPVYARRAPPPPPVSFSARQQALQANPGRPVDPQTINRLRGAAPAQQQSVRTLPARTGGQQGGGTQFGRPGNRPNNDNPQTPVARPRNEPGQSPATTAPRTNPTPADQFPQRRQRPDVTNTPPATTNPTPADQFPQRRQRPDVTNTPPATTNPTPADQFPQRRQRPDVTNTPPATTNPTPADQFPQRRQRPDVTNTPPATTNPTPADQFPQRRQRPDVTNTPPPATNPTPADQVPQRRQRPDVTNTPPPARPAPTEQMQQERRQRQRPEPAPSQPAATPAPAPRPAERPAAREAPKHEDRPARKREDKKEEK